MNVLYEYYKDSFGGSLIPESRWNSLEIKMSARLNRYTFDRMTEGAWPAKARQRSVRCAIVHISMISVTGKRQRIIMVIPYRMIQASH